MSAAVTERTDLADEVAAYLAQFTMTPLERWMEAHHDPKWKYVRPRVAKPRPFKLGRAEYARLAKEHELVVGGIDRRSETAATTLDEWLEEKHNPFWVYKPYVPPVSTGLVKMSAAARRAEEQRVQRYVQSRRAA